MIALIQENAGAFAFFFAFLLAYGVACYLMGKRAGWSERDRAIDGGIVRQIERWSGR